MRALVAAIERLRPFPEVPAALDRLRARYKLVVLSNGDPDMLETARHYHGIAFDQIISVAVAGAFKPHHATYEKAAELAGVRRDEVLFVANHAFDCIGAKATGMRTAFIDRRRRPFGATPHQPDLIVPSMTELAEIMAPETSPTKWERSRRGSAEGEGAAAATDAATCRTEGWQCAGPITLTLGAARLDLSRGAGEV